MNSKKVCFITCVNDDKLYSECLKYINNLNIPESFEIENIEIKDAKSITSGYNEAMKASDAKYKVYLHQDVFIINKDFIKNIIEVFNSDEKIGILGVAGAKTIPTNAVWWDAVQRFGGVYENHTGIMKFLEFNKVKENYVEAKALDGLILVTVQDIPWREDIFTGWHFYDMSQCVEFNLKGYKAVVPRQEEPWCIHDCGFVETTGNYDKYKEIFLDEYSSKIFPLVSIMITAYNRPQYLKVALESALNQTYRNIEIVICDNSTNDECEKLVQGYLYKYNRIRYYKNEKELEVIDNFKKCIELSSGEYAEFLMDDDIYHIDKTSRMMNCFLEHDNIKLVTSYRQTIDNNGNEIKPISATRKLFETDQIVDGKIIIDFVMKTLLNVIGETTTPLFNRSEVLKNGFGKYGGKQYKVNADLVTWISLLSQGKMVYISDTLSYFRLHETQDQNRVISIVTGTNELLDMMNSYFEYNHIRKKEKNEYYINWEKKCKWTLDLDLSGSGEIISEIQKLKKNLNKLGDVLK